MELKTVIGLEIHVQLKTKSKMFCGCDNDAEGKKPNTVVCPVCLGMPGVLPVANKQAIDWTVKTGLALNSEINEKSKFDRKHYFYPDLPKGYQISQYDAPFCKGGFVEIEIDGQKKKINLTRIHLEEDAGKLIHRDGCSLVDLNRAGTPLMEIVTEPDISSPQEAKAFLQKLRTILRDLDVSYADMEKGHLRCDANISQEIDGQEGVPTEIKNLNSFKAVERALAYEEKRQKEAIESGEEIKKETRGWIDAKGITVPQRSKEFSYDYRYFPEPDLPPFVTTQDQISKIKDQISESLESAEQRYQEIGLAKNEIDVILRTPELKNYFNQLTGELKTDGQKILASKWLVNKLSKDFVKRNYPVAQFAEFIVKLDAGQIPSGIAFEMINQAISENKKIDDILKDKGLTAFDISDKINAIVDEVISENESAVSDFKSGKEAALKFLVGQVMAKSKGMANPQEAEELLKEKMK